MIDVVVLVVQIVGILAAVFICLVGGAVAATGPSSSKVHNPAPAMPRSAGPLPRTSPAPPPRKS